MRDAGMKIKSLFNKIYPFILISWRNLWRQKRRSMVVISSIAIGIFAMILSMSFSNGMMDQMVDNTIGTSLGDIAIHRSGFQDSMKLEYNFLPGQRISFLLDKNRSVKAYAPLVKVKGMIRSSEAARGVMIVGVNPAKEKNVSTINHYTIKKAGRPLS
jgi:putative ABC transport system permease protein